MLRFVPKVPKILMEDHIRQRFKASYECLETYGTDGETFLDSINTEGEI